MKQFLLFSIAKSEAKSSTDAKNKCIYYIRQKSALGDLLQHTALAAVIPCRAIQSMKYGRITCKAKKYSLELFKLLFT